MDIDDNLDYNLDDAKRIKHTFAPPVGEHTSITIIKSSDIIIDRIVVNGYA